MRLAGLLPLLLATSVLPAQAAPELPQLVPKDGRSALLVDGAPFLMLGARANNSSNSPDILPKVWPVLERLNANTLEIPVASPTKGQPLGGALVAQLAPDRFLVTGSDVRLRVADASGGNGKMLRVEEGHFDAQGHWVFERVWNGDQTDYGLNFVGKPVWMMVTMGAWR